MKFNDIVNALQCDVIAEGARFNDAELSNIVVSDLMSDVLVVDKENILLVSALSSTQVLRTADNVGAVGVLISNGKPIQIGMGKLAQELGLTLLKTNLPTYDTVLKLGAMQGR